MTMYREILRLAEEGKMSGREIAASCKCSYTTVKRVLNSARERGINFEIIREKSDITIGLLIYPKVPKRGRQLEPDYEYVHRELAKSGVTLMLLWNEYCDKCAAAALPHYMYTQFCNRYRQYAVQNKLTFHLTHKPGEVMEVDWAGTKMAYRNGPGGEERNANLFVACLPFSGYCYAEATNDQKQDSWQNAHINAFRYFQGTTRLLRPDNLKTGVKKPDRYEPEINQSYRELAEYYGCFVSPARVLKPRDKSSVECTVGLLTTHIIAALRDKEFYSLNELNNAVRERLEGFNNKPFQKKEGSRKSVYETEERSMMTALPEHEFVIAHYKEQTVPYSYHVNIDGTYYSVPCSYASKKVQIRTAGNLIECFFHGERIAAHPRSEVKGSYVTDQSHMPEAHRRMLEWDADKYLAWGTEHGPSTLTVIDKILKKNGSRVIGDRFCAGLLSLDKKYGAAALEKACARILELQSTPSLKSIKLALSSRNTLQEDINIRFAENDDNSSVIGFRRGSAYYGGRNND